MTIVNLQIPFESLIAAISSLDLQEKHKLLEFLEEQLLEDEEDLMEQNPQIISEIAEARQAYQNGDYQTIQEYIANQTPQIS
ncbi:hypothetical protein MEN41_08740 [Dolichospermum sp. ST_con]|jgi:hypothetical protein|nr:hypothetical protein [Dolichospermum sp. ST_con]MDD1418933.1 hypothetical protein [Dolichospermum sp. ST_sed1]MDD1424696.1 hypothetical protein [Dolichospermum sp. ST_sed9]MDD1431144.1 hypothetical protein [Dolichospermum sp. ST_sed6]MDD1437572.1 hypothetical protein [Dolichospermum sp. ST_sed10]MDD1440589.1 hypothetical protein [Dolichospermum sp. ST_sed3]MDD1446505.1 hypothetical protein [Dolichospermum sp. ST_sed8]MDD1454631.1 hypothetical protein [Dolichospermum sp. ST_sed7]MDD146061